MDLLDQRDSTPVQELESELEPQTLPAMGPVLDSVPEHHFTPLDSGSTNDKGTTESVRGLEAHIEAHKIVSISLGKIYHSQIQRGGSSKLRKNLLVSLVLRSAQKVYLSRAPEVAQGWRGPDGTQGWRGQDSTHTWREPEETLLHQGPEENRCCSAFDGTKSHPCPGGQDCLCQPVGNPEEGLWREYRPSVEQGPSSDDVECALWASGSDRPEIVPTPRFSRKRVAEEKEAESASPKRGRWEPGDQEVPEAGEDSDMDTGNVSSLVSIFGAGFSGLLGKGGTGEGSVESGEDSGNSQGCCERGLNAGLGAWSTAIEAF